MAKLPRLVLASLSEQEEPSATTLAVMAALRGRGYQVQHFRSLAAFIPIDYVTPLTGIASRHLDPWIMTGALTRELFARSAAHADVSIIEGSISSGSDAEAAVVSDARRVAEVLNAPVIGVIRSQSSEVFHATAPPAGIDALLIEGFVTRERYDAEKAAMEGLYRLPVLGGLATCRDASEWIEKFRLGRRVSGAVLEELSKMLLEVTRLDKLLELAESRSFPGQTSELFASAGPRRTLRVAIAYDDCFQCYFPDAIDALELLGAEISQFSPLVDERLPEGTDIVYMGCGHPERFAEALAENECMRAALREHVCSGRRVYAEGGGTAYFCRQIRLPDGDTKPMVGILPAEAQFTGQPLPRPQPVVLECERATWIAGQGDTVRGYRSGAWRLEPRPGFAPWFASGTADTSGVVRHHCVGSTVHLNFAAQPRVLESFFAPHAPSLEVTRSLES